MQALQVPISVGELIDKITILKIKQGKITDMEKLANINHELSELEKTWEASKDPSIDITDLLEKLKNVNTKLWEIEDKIRAKESSSEFDQEFIELARSVYQQNDLRAALKKEVNIRTGSALTEEKSYRDY